MCTTIDGGHRQKCRRSIAGAAAKSCTSGDALLDGYLCATIVVGEALSVELAGSIDNVVLGSQGNLWHAVNSKRRARLDVQNIVKVDSNEDRLDRVKAIGTSSQDPKSEVDLCLGSN